MATYKLAYTTPETYELLQSLAKRDGRPPWQVVKDALNYYQHVHKGPREPQASKPRKRGRPPGTKNKPRTDLLT